MAERWIVVLVVGTLVSPVAVWWVKSQVDRIATVDDVAEVRDVAESAQQTAAQAQRTADGTRDDLDSLLAQLVESTSDVDTPLLARIQDDLEGLRADVNDIEAELRRQSRVETEQSVNLGRLVSALESSGVEVDDALRDELENSLPNDSNPVDPRDSNDFYRGGKVDE